MQSDESKTDQSDTNSVKFTAGLNIVYMCINVTGWKLPFLI